MLSFFRANKKAPFKPNRSPRLRDRRLRFHPALESLEGRLVPTITAGITTLPAWDGVSSIAFFGVPNTATYGETITAPSAANLLNNFSFEMHQPTTDVFRGEVYAWDGTKATGPSLYESNPMSTTDGSGFQLVTFHTGGIALVAGQQYVLFASVSKDFGTGDDTGEWGETGFRNDTYAGGNFVSLNNGSNTSMWTTMSWATSPLDLAFSATFGSTATLTAGQVGALNLGNFTDTNTTETASQLNALINWGDGTMTSGNVTGSSGNFSVSGTHGYLRDGQYTVTATLSNGTDSDTATSLVTVGSSTVASLQITGPATAVAGAPSNITVSALDAFGNIVTGFTDTVSISSSDSEAALPPNYVFTTADAGRHTFSVTLNGTGLQSVSAADTTEPGVNGSLQNIVVTLPIVTGVDLGQAASVQIDDPVTGAVIRQINPYESTFSGGVRVATVDWDRDGVPDFVTAPGGVQISMVNINGSLFPSFDFSAGRAPEIKIFDGADGHVLADFMAYDPSFKAGVFVAVGDLAGNGTKEIITGPDATGQAGHTNVRVFFQGNNTGIPDHEFNAYASGFGGGVRVATGDLSGRGYDDIITAPGIWGGPDIRVFDGRQLMVNNQVDMVGEFLAYDYRYTGGEFVASGDLNGDAIDDIVTGTNGMGGPETKAFDGATVLGNPNPNKLADFFAYDPNFNGGDRVAVMDSNNDGHGDIVTSTGSSIVIAGLRSASATPSAMPIKVFSGHDGSLIDSFFAFGPSNAGAAFVGGLADPPTLHINTMPAWDGSTSVAFFGVPNTATYGQIITAPTFAQKLDDFSFEMHLPTTDVFRGEIYAWDGTKAVGPSLYESAPMSTTDGSSFQLITFHTQGINVVAGQQYVIFASVSKDFGTGDGTGEWGSTSRDSYSGGTFVLLNNGSDISQWTTQPWTSDQADLAFKVNFQ